MGKARFLGRHIGGYNSFSSHSRLDPLSAASTINRNPLRVPHNTSRTVSLAARRQSDISSCMCWHPDIIGFDSLKPREPIVSGITPIAVVQIRTEVELRLRGEKLCVLAKKGDAADDHGDW